MLKPEESVIVFIDVQGKLAQIMHQTESLHNKLTGLILGAQLFEMPIVWLEQLPDKLGATAEPLNSLLAQTSSPIAKHHFSAWPCEAFRNQLAELGRKNIIIAGIEAHICVYQTCSDLIDQGFNLHVVSDCVSSRTAENKNLGIQMMQAKGAQVTGLETLLFELQHEAQGERFKKLLKIIK
ncbi:hydrolase [Shewanella gelidii]|uniref:Hydrolase n=1 Tax=Shewanella gelidii TaxID=1642821 RepID=A0A917JZ99_9GAMM|nr:hydrolase [Shewanella gelidii]MCL1099313.1 hydrolase [Shewanella gelidii]GGI91940.1 hydrolase [Shewanella gelidii]